MVVKLWSLAFCGKLRVVEEHVCMWGEDLSLKPWGSPIWGLAMREDA